MTTEIVDHIRQVLDIPIESKDINSVYRTKKIMDNNTSPRILVSFSTTSLKNEVILKAKSFRNQSSTNPKIFFIMNIFFLARQLQKNKKMHATWIYRGEVYRYLWKEQTSKPVTIITSKELS